MTLLITGGYFLLPQVTDINQEWIHTFWPGIFILVGLLILFKKRRYRPHWKNKYKGKERLEECVTVDGFINSEVSFGGVHQIVLDPVFKGAKINNSFGSTVLDLRKTTLEASETYIDMECSFGSIELLIPSHWNVIVETDTSFSGVSDKRRSPMDNQIDFDHKLIIRGDISFSGLEIKS
ncbi:MAG: cell wall-active antibiotics response protein [Tannerellaceae bacterium]|nr:cell wall-active antibiotics response protein [Tannerellaceae bacterium]